MIKEPCCLMHERGTIGHIQPKVVVIVLDAILTFFYINIHALNGKKLKSLGINVCCDIPWNKKKPLKIM